MSHMWVKHCYIGLRWITVWVIDGSSMGLRWVTNGSHMNHTFVTLSSTTFFIFFPKLVNFCPLHSFATLRIRKMIVIFEKSEKSNPVVSFITLACHKSVFCTWSRWDNLLCWAFICWVGWRVLGGVFTASKCILLIADWDARLDRHGRIFYIDHANRTTTWQKPSKNRTQSRVNNDLQRLQLDRRWVNVLKKKN